MALFGITRMKNGHCNQNAPLNVSFSHPATAEPTGRLGGSVVCAISGRRE
jgi:hypothetical protein